ncbi:1-(5-phosphoribosyl)-5-[(5-phosphoribosylamino)methylideneamino]imidazole-4-carboxamide isomerase [Candidatus Pantoea carbekii]|uniref:1-(5-phosphoribosyl)-5-[(5- phosphoribosylamino)methylideneamino]imidazole-4- carboxamide isomerase n=1 Tax=Candidatus Pantoea carbekii TaxID=1235990 RepID=UPI0006187A01|nr:1-(5-phosphoribosyl)-5-[(5-phosphoribosylamino)methylideneamino]imidazole-4-carboxamide isomerase [Candidatus Pantoea carbekii]AKC32020.1 1-(5-phosphoribosyl)-5- (5-phosphoribosylamino)methylideneamino imidazole-4-carboxamide isomerase [Candidatus Pantoea carbekii]
MIIPALDIIEGKVVRLHQGDYNQQFNYGDNSLEFLQYYINQGAELIHLVDLTGAESPQKRQITLFENLLRNINIQVQVGGGIRNRDDVASLLDIGVSRVVVGSAAIKNPEEVKNWFHEFGTDAIVLAIDVRTDIKNHKKIAISGWKETVDVELEQVINWYRTIGLRHVLCTDISCDGTLNGANILLYKEISEMFPSIAFQSSGGIGSLNDILALRSSGAQSVIIGRALLENRFTISEAISCWQNG